MTTKALENRIIKVSKCSYGLTQQEVLDLPKQKRIRALTLAEWRAILKDDKLAKEYDDYWPARTSTWISYEAGATKALIWNDGDKQKTEIPLPLKDGWYSVDEKWGLPNGNPSSSSDPDALDLWRYQSRSFTGLLVRGGYRFLGDGRFVFAGVGPSDRYGVLGVRRTPHKHKFVKQPAKCECGEEKR